MEGGGGEGAEAETGPPVPSKGSLSQAAAGTEAAAAAATKALATAKGTAAKGAVVYDDGSL